MLNVCTRIFFPLCRFCGIFPFKIHKSEITAQHALYLARVVITSIIYTITHAIICYQKISSKIALHEIMFLVCSCYTMFVLYFVQLKNYSHKSEIVKYYTELSQLQAGLRLHCKIPMKTHINSIVIAELVVILLTFFYFFYIYIYSFDVYKSLLFTLGCTIPKLIIIMSSILFCNLVLILYKVFKMLNYATQLNIHDNTLDYLLMYCQVTSISKLLLKVYGYQHLLVIGNYTGWIIYELYHFILLLSHYHKGKEISLITIAISWLLVQFAVFVFLVICSVVTKAETDRYMTTWNMVMIKDNLMENTTLSLKLLHERLTFSAGGWFDIKFSLLFTTIGTSITFLVILTQFSKEL